MILVDSSVWVDFFNGVESPQVNVLDASLGKVTILVGDLILTEILQGFRQTRDFNAAKTALKHLDYRDMLGRDIPCRAPRTIVCCADEAER